MCGKFFGANICVEYAFLETKRRDYLQLYLYCNDSSLKNHPGLKMVPVCDIDRDTVTVTKVGQYRDIFNQSDLFHVSILLPHRRIPTFMWGLCKMTHASM